MAVLSAPFDIGIKPGDEARMQMAAVKIYQGGAVGVVSGVGYATPLLIATTGMTFEGVAEETVDNSAGSAGDKWIRVRRRGLAGFNSSALTVANIGDALYFVGGSDDNTVSSTVSAIFAGYLAAYDSNGVAWVAIDGAVHPYGTASESAVTYGEVLSGGTYQGITAQSATQNYLIGTKREMLDGRVFRYAVDGGAGSARALMQQTAVKDAKFIDITQTGHAQVAGATSLTVLCTTGSGIADDYFAGGSLIVTTGTNAGDKYEIVSSALETTDTLLDIVLATPLRNAIAATDKIALLVNRWTDTLIVPTTTATAAPAGVPLIAVTASYYYWAQTRGPAPLVVDTGDTLVVGGKAGIPATNADAGACGVATATAFAYPIYGTVLWIGAATEPALINLELE